MASLLSRFWLSIQTIVLQSIVEDAAQRSYLLWGKRRTSVQRGIVTSQEATVRRGTGKREDLPARMRRLLANHDLFARAKSLESLTAYCTLGIPTAGVFLHSRSRILIYQFHERASSGGGRTWMSKISPMRRAVSPLYFTSSQVVPRDNAPFYDK